MKLALVFLLLLSSSAHAVSGWYVSSVQVGQCYSTQQEACSKTDPTWYIQFSQCRKTVNGSAFVVGGFSSCTYDCAAGQERFNGLCVAQCSAGKVRNPSSGTCDCPVGQQDDGSGSCVPIPCPSGQYRDPSSGECVWPTSCPQGQSLFKTTGPGGTVTSAVCVPNVERPETEPCITYAQMQSKACQEEAQDCTATGGTFGVIGNKNVCIPPGHNPPPCASGASQFVTNPDGSSSASCVGAPNIGNGNIANAPISGGQNTSSTPEAQSAADTANNTAAIAQIANQGFQAVVNAVNTQTSKGGGGGASGSGSTAEQDKENSDGVVQAINDFKNQEKGAGQCDPKAENYSQCMGLTEEGVDENQLKGDATTAGTTSLDSAKDAAVESITERADVEAPTEFVGAILDRLPQPVSCAPITMTWKGNSLNITCDDTEVMRLWFAWLFSMLTIWHMAQVALAPRGN